MDWYRIGIYLFTMVDIGIGFLILHRAKSRFGFLTYRRFLDRQRKSKNRGVFARLSEKRSA